MGTHRSRRPSGWQFLGEDTPPIHAAASRALEKMYGEWGTTPGLPTPAVAVHRMADFLDEEGWRPPPHVIETPENEGDYTAAIAALDTLPRRAIVQVRNHVFQSIGSGWWETVGQKPATPADITPVSPRLVVPPSTVCEACGVYVIYPDRHETWHRREDAKASRWERFRRMVLDVFQARGYITTDEKTTATDGDT